MAEGTRIGQVQLQVASIPAAEELYVGALGFEPTVRHLPGRSLFRRAAITTTSGSTRGQAREPRIRQAIGPC